MEQVTQEPQSLGFWGNIKHSFKAFGTVEYWKDLAHQTTGWHPTSYMLFGFAVGLQAITFVNNPMTWLSLITMVSSLLGVATILSISQGKALNGWLGALSVIGLVYVAFSAKNYLQISEQLIYLFTLDLPVILNVDWNKNMAKKIGGLNFKQWAVTLVGWGVLWAVSAYGIGHLTDDPRPVVDALVFATATVGGLLTFFKKRESYYAWLLTGITSVWLWAITFQQGDASIAMLLSSLVYVMNDAIGFTVSPWFSKKGRARLATQEADYLANKNK